MLLNILVVDDEKGIRKMIAFPLEHQGHKVFFADNGPAALKEIGKNPIDLVFLDYEMPGINGIDTLKEIKKLNPELPVIIVTGFTRVDLATEAMRAGAFDFINKPFKIELVAIAIDKAIRDKKQRLELEQLREIKKNSYSGIIGEAANMQSLFQTIDKVAKLPVNSMLLTGESGTGKELVARALHSKSNANDEPLIEINCSALPENLLESELFGYEAGAFTDARERKLGLFELAGKGFVFLDEIGDMKLDLQAKLLRVLENRTVRRIGGKDMIPIEARVIAATHKNLRKMIAEHQFREDLYYRLNVVEINIPPLRERENDVILLSQFYIDHYNRQFNKSVIGLAPKAEKFLLSYEFPGNVRELKNMIERAVVMAEGDMLSLELLQKEPSQEKKTEGKWKIEFNSLDLEKDIDYDTFTNKILHEITVMFLQKMLAKHSHSVAETAKAMNLNRTALHNILKRHGVSPKEPA